jgi:hypothetical protein
MSDRLTEQEIIDYYRELHGTERKIRVWDEDLIDGNCQFIEISEQGKKLELFITPTLQIPQRLRQRIRRPAQESCGRFGKGMSKFNRKGYTSIPARTRDGGIKFIAVKIGGRTHRSYTRFLKQASKAKQVVA